LFEVGVTFRLGADDEPFTQLRKAGGVLCGPAGTGWAAERRALDVHDAKGVLETLLRDLGVTAWTLGDVPPGPFHPGRSARVLVGGRAIGVLGEIHPRVTEGLDIDGRVALVVVGLGSLQEAADRAFELREVPRFPPVRRDLAFVVPHAASAGAVQEALEGAAGELLGACELFDVFRGGSLAVGTKSLAFAVDFRAPDRTLTDDEAQEAVERIVSRLAADFGAQLRSG
jgi:phenylalanyl-tRNA synthetase beta chain